eukprot:GILK01010386.1.p1 GENE.GILK01010386.1~~GILK01010386.1.p1  ORF type:complete len:153 (-),score=5.69 GILK01010386.1:353-811(-)
MHSCIILAALPLVLFHLLCGLHAAHARSGAEKTHFLTGNDCYKRLGIPSSEDKRQEHKAFCSIVKDKLMGERFFSEQQFRQLCVAAVEPELCWPQCNYVAVIFDRFAPGGVEEGTGKETEPSANGHPFVESDCTNCLAAGDCFPSCIHKNRC